MSGTAARKRDRYTWDDYRTWADDERWEIINGDAYLMSPSPTTRHQLVSVELRLDLAAVFDFPLEPGEEPPAVWEPPSRYSATGSPNPK